MSSSQLADFPESVAIYLEGGGQERIPSPWVYFDLTDNKWKCDACGKEMCYSHFSSQAHGRKVWYYCYGYQYGRDWVNGKVENAVKWSVHHAKDFQYPFENPTMLQEETEQQGIEYPFEEAQGSHHWADAAVLAAAPAGAPNALANLQRLLQAPPPEPAPPAAASASHPAAAAPPGLQEKLEEKLEEMTEKLQEKLEEKLEEKLQEKLQEKIEEMTEKLEKLEEMTAKEQHAMTKKLEEMAEKLEEKLTPVSWRGVFLKAFACCAGGVCR